MKGYAPSRGGSPNSCPPFTFTEAVSFVVNCESQHAPTRQGRSGVVKAMLAMDKLDIEALRQAHEGEPGA